MNKCVQGYTQNLPIKKMCLHDFTLSPDYFGEHNINTKQIADMLCCFRKNDKEKSQSTVSIAATIF